MTPTPSPTLRPRFTLYRKIFASFFIITVFVITAVLFISQQNNSLFSSSPPEFTIAPLSQSMKGLLNAENDAARIYFTTKTYVDSQTFGLQKWHFVQALDSLLQMPVRIDVKDMIGEILEKHKRYGLFIEGQSALIKKNLAYDALPEFQTKQTLVDSMQQQLRVINDINNASLIRVLKYFVHQLSDTYWDKIILFSLSLVIATIMIGLVARTLTKPIKALKAGTEKVGEGHYETVPILSNDEVADLTRAFNLMSDKLKQLDEMRVQLMSEISHEMRTPLQVIKAGCYAIIHTKDGPVLTQRQRDAVGMIHQATNRINQFVNSFLDVAKMEAGLMTFQFEQTNLVELITPLVQEAQLIAQTRQIKVEFNPEEIPLFQIDKERMGQVFSNLLSNALKYTPNEGSVTVTVAKLAECDGLDKNGKGCVRVNVRDSGVGIPEADIEKLFNKFYQAKNTPLVNEKGSGLGLALVKHVSEAHGGKVTVVSKVGEGSMFSVTLPL